MTTAIMTYEIVTDGACSNNQADGGQPGGWAFQAYSNPHGRDTRPVQQKAGGKFATTNQEMELLAALEALHYATYEAAVHVIIVSDSQYVVKGSSEWLANWIKNNWRGANKKPVAHKEHWQAIASLLETRRELGLKTEFTWVKGHNGHPRNEFCDQCAVAAIVRRPGHDTPLSFRAHEPDAADNDRPVGPHETAQGGLNFNPLDAEATIATPDLLIEQTLIEEPQAAQAPVEDLDTVHYAKAVYAILQSHMLAYPDGQTKALRQLSSCSIGAVLGNGQQFEISIKPVAA